MQSNKFRYGFEKTLCMSSLVKPGDDIIPGQTFEEFYNLSSKICELEALTFQTEENKAQLNDYYIEFNKFTHEFNNCMPHVVLIEEWRFIAGLYCCFMEWCENTCYFSLNEDERSFIWSENPLCSIILTTNPLLL